MPNPKKALLWAATIFAISLFVLIGGTIVVRVFLKYKPDWLALDTTRAGVVITLALVVLLIAYSIGAYRVYKDGGLGITKKWFQVATFGVVIVGFLTWLFGDLVFQAIEASRQNARAGAQNAFDNGVATEGLAAWFSEKIDGVLTYAQELFTTMSPAALLFIIIGLIALAAIWPKGKAKK